jgi:hypothetical protein
MPWSCQVSFSQQWGALSREASMKRHSLVISTVSQDVSVQQPTGTNMREIYGDTLTVIRSNTGYFLGFTMLSVLLDWLDANEVAGLILALVLTLQVYLHLLSGQSLSLRHPLSGTKWSSIGKFVILNVLVISVPAALTVGLGFGLIQQGIADNSSDQFIGTLVAVFLLSYGGLLIAVGTALPATLAGEGLIASLSLDRSRETALGIAIGLAVGPAAMSAAYFAISYYLTGSIDYTVDLSSSRELDPFEVALAVALDFLSTLQMVMAIVVLCRAYRRVMPRPAIDRLEEVFG